MLRRPGHPPERLLGWPQAGCVWFNPRLPLIVVVLTSLITLVLPWIVELFYDQAQDHDRLL
jgi:hypothetical protein